MEMNLEPPRKECSDFLKRAYAMVDDPLTDSVISWSPDGKSFIVWMPEECKRVTIPKYLQVKMGSFGGFYHYGFRRIMFTKERVIFAWDDFVRGKPELLDNICQREMARLKAVYDKDYKPYLEQIINCKTRAQVKSLKLERIKLFRKRMSDNRAALAKALAASREAAAAQAAEDAALEAKAAAVLALEDQHARETMSPPISVKMIPQDRGSSVRNEVVDFVKKAYEMVDDPSTDAIVSWSPDGTSFIVWKQLECERDLLTKHLQIFNFNLFERYGFREIAPGQGHLELACNGFVRGKPELLDKIAEAFVAFTQPFRDRYDQMFYRLGQCKNAEERKLVIKEVFEKREKEYRERQEAARLAAAVERLRAKRLQDQMQHVQI